MSKSVNSPASSKPYHYLDQLRDDILRMIPADGEIIGSIGCGFATTEKALVDQGREVHGVDVSQSAIEVARTRLTTARVVAPSDDYPFERDSLDGLILADIIEHLPMAWERLACFAEMVKPGGWVVISVPNMRNFEILATLVIKGEWYEFPLGIFDATHL